MGATIIDVYVSNSEPLEREKATRVKNVLVDTGSTLTVLPQTVLKELGIPQYKTQQARVFDGRSIERGVGFAILEYKGKQATIEVLFAMPEDELVLGTIALEAMGFSIYPGSRQLEPRPVIY